MLTIAVKSGTHYTLTEVLSPYMWVFFFAWLLAIITTPIFRHIALKNGIVDWPDLKRKQHPEPIAYLGGIAIFLGWLAGVAAGYMVEPHYVTANYAGPEPSLNFPISIIIGAILITLVGVIDDVHSLSPRVKLGGQLLAAACLAGEQVGTNLARGIFVPIVKQMGYSADIVPHWFLYWMGAFIVVIFVLGGCNAANLLDGLDGLVGGVTAIVATGFTVIAVALAMGLYSTGGAYSPTDWDPIRLVTCMALLGAVLGFLPYNFHPANIFLGDAGSMLIGFLCVSTILMFAERGEANLVMAALVVFAVPILDTTLAIVRRKMRGQKLSSADAQHLHHQLIKAGFRIRQAVTLLYVMAIAFAFLGCMMIFIRLRFVVCIFLVIFSFIMITAYKIGHRQFLVQEREKKEKAQTTTTTPAQDHLDPELDNSENQPTIT